MIIAITNRKLLFTTMKASFSKKNFLDFIIGLLSGKETKWLPYKTLPTIKTVKPWDGEDHKPKVHDEF